MDRDLEVFKACADETRLRILVLLGQGQLCVCEIVDVLDMPQGKVSRHLAVLRRAGLVEDERRGTWIHYSLSENRSENRSENGSENGSESGSEIRQTTPLTRRLLAYLKGEARDHKVSCCDLQRLQELCDCGEICVSGKPLAVGTRAQRV